MARPVTLKNIQKIEYFGGTGSYSSVIGLSVPTGFLQGTGTGTSQILFSHDGTSNYVNRGLCAGSNIEISYSDEYITINSTGGGGGGTTSPSGANTQIQYNDNNSFGADASFTWNDGSSGTSTLGVSGDINLTGGRFLLNTSTGVSAFEITSNNQSSLGQITFYKAGISVTIGPSNMQSSYSLLLPPADGTDGQVLQTDGSGNLSFVTNTGASSINELSDGFSNNSFTNLIMGPDSSTYAATTGSNNVGIGLGSLFSVLAAGNKNVAMGNNALASLTTAENNTAIGHNAGQSFTDQGLDDFNTVVGHNAMSNAGSGACSNVAIGHNAGKEFFTGNFNVFIGTSSGSGTCNSGVSNSIVIGYNAQGSGVNNEITLGNPTIETLRCAESTIASLSDARDKNDIRDSTYGLNFLENIRPVEFTWDRRVLTSADENDPKQGKRRVGFIAQELQEAMPDGENDILDLVYTSNPKRLEAKYGNLIPVMVKAIQDLKSEVDTIKEHLNLE